MILEGLNTEAELAAAERSSLYAWLATVFSFPTPGLSETIASGALSDEVEDMASALPYPLPANPGLGVDPGLGHETIEQDYISTFDVGPGRPPCPLYEGSHRRGRPQIMEDLVRFYEHFGLRHAEEDLPDHLCTEFEFMHYLAFKQAAALRAGSDSEPYRLAQRDFLDRHLMRWLPLLRGRLAQLEAPSIYQSLARLAEEACRRDRAFVAGEE